MDYFIVFIKEINCCFILFFSIEVKKPNRNFLGKMPHLKMPHLKMPINASFLYVNCSSSCGRETIHFTFLLLLFSSLWFSVVQSRDCEGYDIKKEGKKIKKYLES